MLCLKPFSPSILSFLPPSLPSSLPPTYLSPSILFSVCLSVRLYLSHTLHLFLSIALWIIWPVSILTNKTAVEKFWHNSKHFNIFFFSRNLYYSVTVEFFSPSFLLSCSFVVTKGYKKKKERKKSRYSNFFSHPFVTYRYYYLFHIPLQQSCSNFFC